MLITKIRTGIQSPITKFFLLFLFVALFGGFGIFGVLKKILSGGTSDNIALVNGLGVSRSLYNYKKDELDERVKTIYQRFGKNAPLILQMQGLDKDVQTQAFNLAVRETLLDQVVQNTPIYLSEDYVQAKLKDPYFFVSRFYHLMPQGIADQQGRVNIDLFNHFLATNNTASLEAELENSLKQETALDLVKNGFWLPDFITKDVYKNQQSQKKYSIISFSLDDAIKNEKEKGATDKELEEFFNKENDKNKRYYIPAKRNGKKWVFDVKDFTLEISEKELKDYYNKIKRSRFVETPTQVKIRQIMFTDIKEKGLVTLQEEAEKVRQEALKDPSKFSELAKKYSSDKDTASKGGIVDFFKRGTNNKHIERAAFVNLKSDNEISVVIDLGNKEGYALVQRVARKETTYKPFEKVKAEVEKLARAHKFQREFVKKTTPLIRAKGEEAQKRFKEFVTKNKATGERVAAVAKNEDPIAARLFSLKKSGDRIAYISDGKGVVLELDNILRKNLPPFNMLKPYVEKDFYAQRAKKNLKKLLDAEEKKAQKEGSLSKVQGGKVKKTDWISPTDEQAFKKLLEQGVPQDIMLLDKKGGVIAVLNDSGGFLISLDELKLEKNDDTKKKETELKTTLDKSLSSVFMQAFIASLQRNATIEIKEKSEMRNDHYEI